LVSEPWALLDQRARGTRFLDLSIHSALNSPQQTGMDFWSINPYVGCEFGCSYCYARFAHRYVVERRGGSWSAGDFERRIFVKREAPDVVALTLQPARLAGHAVVIGTATDPYQPAERTYRVTRGVLERLAQLHGVKVGIISKSPLITRDVDVLARLAARGELTVIVSLITTDAPLIRKLERRSPTPEVRLKALRKLVDAGLHAGVLVAPVLPGITDGVARLTALVHAAQEAGAHFVRADPLRLYPQVRPLFLPIVAREFPALLPAYQRAFDERGIVRREYARALTRRLAAVKRRVGFVDRGADPAVGYQRGVVQERLAL
jgi:DNA repair photolyase